MNERQKKLIRQMKQGDKDAANALIGLYFDRVVRAAQNRLSMRNAGGAEGDDIAASVFESLWRRAKNQRFDEDDLASPDELWCLLSRMIHLKTDEHARRAAAQKRGRGQVGTESVLGTSDSHPGIAGHADMAFTPDELVEFEEGVQHLLSTLGDERLCQICVLRMEGYRITEIAEETGRSESSIKRGLALVRDIWKDALTP